LIEGDALRLACRASSLLSNFIAFYLLCAFFTERLKIQAAERRTSAAL